MNAGLIEGTYSGARATYSGYPLPNAFGFNVPATKVNSNAYWLVVGLSAASTATNFSQVNWSNTLVIANGSTYLKPNEAWNIDTKIDDGMPGTGKVTANKGDGTSTFCTSVAGSTTDAGATYRLDITNKDCMVYFPNTI